MKRVFVVMCVDSGDSCDSRPHILGTFDTYESAYDYVQQDIEEYEKNGHKDIDYDDMCCDTCVWNIEELV